MLTFVRNLVRKVLCKYQIKGKKRQTVVLTYAEIEWP